MFFFPNCCSLYKIVPLHFLSIPKKKTLYPKNILANSGRLGVVALKHIYCGNHTKTYPLFENKIDDVHWRSYGEWLRRNATKWVSASASSSSEPAGNFFSNEFQMASATTLIVRDHRWKCIWGQRAWCVVRWCSSHICEKVLICDRVRASTTTSPAYVRECSLNNVGMRNVLLRQVKNETVVVTNVVSFSRRKNNATDNNVLKNVCPFKNNNNNNNKDMKRDWYEDARVRSAKNCI